MIKEPLVTDITFVEYYFNPYDIQAKANDKLKLKREFQLK